MCRSWSYRSRGVSVSCFRPVAAAQSTMSFRSANSPTPKLRSERSENTGIATPAPRHAGRSKRGATSFYYNACGLSRTERRLPVATYLPERRIRTFVCQHELVTHHAAGLGELHARTPLNAAAPLHFYALLRIPVAERLALTDQNGMLPRSYAGNLGRHEQLARPERRAASAVAARKYAVGKHRRTHRAVGRHIVPAVVYGHRRLCKRRLLASSSKRCPRPIHGARSARRDIPGSGTPTPRPKTRRKGCIPTYPRQHIASGSPGRNHGRARARALRPAAYDTLYGI